MLDKAQNSGIMLHPLTNGNQLNHTIELLLTQKITIYVAVSILSSSSHVADDDHYACRLYDYLCDNYSDCLKNIFLNDYNKRQPK